MRLLSRILSAAVASLLLAGCCSNSDGPELGVPIDLGVDVDLHAVIAVGDYYENLAVGAEGTIVAWGEDFSHSKTKVIVDVDKIGDVVLRSAWIAREYDYGPSTSWWVVGDGGTIASSDNHGATWNAFTLPGIDADLYGITGFGDLPVVVGDETVLVRQPDGTWIEPPAPLGGWGSLRGVAANEEEIFAVGLAGRVWSSTRPSVEWVAEWVDVQVDLYNIDNVGRMVVVGAQGMLLVSTSNGWRQVDTGLSENLLDVQDGLVLAADGGIYDLDWDDSLELLVTVPNALAINRSLRISAVGLDGLATWPPPGC